MDLINTNTATVRHTVDTDVQALVSRSVRKWLNTCPDKPCSIAMEYLPDDFGIALSVTETAYKVKQYITGGYLAAYECDLIYRCMPSTDDERVEADELLDGLAHWATHARSGLLIAGCHVRKVSQTSLSTLSARYSNGAEDHTTHLSIQFEVISHVL